MRELLAKITDIPKNGSLIIETSKGQEVALFNLEGHIYALENICPHAEGPVGEGDIHNGCVTCPWHGWEFEIETGECTTMPGEAVKKVPIEIKDGKIYL